MKQFFFVCFLLGISPCLHAVNNLRLPDIRCMGMGMCGVTNSSLFNPALISRENSKSVDINYFNYYGLKELGTVNVAFSYPNDFLSAGVDISSFGYDQYRESMFRLFLGKPLGERWSIGISLQYTLLQTKLMEESPQYLSADVGILFTPVEKLLIGMLIQDFPSVEILKKNADIESIIYYSLQIGFQWEVINNLLIVGNAETDKQTTVSGRIGIEYQLIDHFYVRTGIRTTPLLPTLGVGYWLSGFVVDVAVHYHPVLGISTGIGLKYCF